MGRPRGTKQHLGPSRPCPPLSYTWPGPGLLPTLAPPPPPTCVLMSSRSHVPVSLCSHVPISSCSHVLSQPHVHMLSCPCVSMSLCPNICMSPCPHSHVPLPPSLCPTLIPIPLFSGVVHTSLCSHVFMSLCLHPYAPMTLHLHVPISLYPHRPFPFSHVPISMPPCLIISMSPCPNHHIPMSLCHPIIPVPTPWFPVPISPSLAGPRSSTIP